MIIASTSSDAQKTCMSGRKAVLHVLWISVEAHDG